MAWTSGTVGGGEKCISGCGGGRWGTRTLRRLRVNRGVKETMAESYGDRQVAEK